jgi:hypothetical protein
VLASYLVVHLTYDYAAFWATLMLEYWKRNEATKAMEWGMTGYEAEEKDRPEFVGTPMKSYIDGRVRA